VPGCDREHQTLDRATGNLNRNSQPMTNLLKLPPFDRQGNVHVVVETPRGAKAKLKHDPELKVFVLSKSLMAGLTYPYDWGFVPSTAADDGDPVDALVGP
jgi:inorganic pyrophosphatase